MRNGNGFAAGQKGKDPRRERGRAGEAFACQHLTGNGYKILQTNFRTRYGEIDIIARRGGVVAFVEVKARCDARFGEPFEAVGLRKQNQIRRMAEMWVAAHQSDPSLKKCIFRFDVVSIKLDKHGCVEHCEHLVDAFR